MTDRVTIGKIVKAQGIKGDVKILAMTDDKERFGKLKSVIIDNTPFEIQALRTDSGSKDTLFVKFALVDDRNAAESMVGKYVCIDKIHAVECKAFEYFIEDLIGCTISLDNEPYGTLVDIGQYGAADVHTVRALDDTIVRYPFLKILIDRIDIPNKQIFYHKQEFDKVSVADKL